MSESTERTQEAVRRKILWKCRRGTKELDVFLERFVLNHFENLEPREIDLLDQLLDVEDPLLTEWLCFSVKPNDHGMEKIVTKILSADID